MRRYDESIRRCVIELVDRTRVRSGWPVKRTLRELGIAASSYFAWTVRPTLAAAYQMPKGLCEPLPQEKAAVCAFALEHPDDGYRRLTWMLLDADIAALSASSVYRTLRDAGLNRRWRRSSCIGLRRPAKPTRPDEQWHTDLMYLWVAGRWYFFVAVLDAYSRYVVHWELLTSMLANDVVGVMHAALLLVPDAKPRVVHDRGVQFIGKEFKALVKQFALEDIKIRVRHPQSNGIYERFNGTTRREGIGSQDLRDLYQAREIIAAWVTYYNTQRLHSSLGYLPPVEYYRGRPELRQQLRRDKLAAAMQTRIAANKQRITQQAA